MSEKASFTKWFTSLPEDRKEILVEDRFMFAEAAFNAGYKASCPVVDVPKRVVRTSGGSEQHRTIFLHIAHSVKEQVVAELAEFGEITYLSDSEFGVGQYLLIVSDRYDYQGILNLIRIAAGFKDK